MGRNLTNLYISSSFQFLTQVSGSELQDGLGNKITGSLDITASRADNATSASFASTSVSSSYSTTALSASYAATATSSSVAINATSASYATNALSSSYALTASYAANVPDPVSTGSLMVTGSVNSNTLTFTKGDGSTFNLTVATGSAVTTPTGSLLTTASAAGNVLTFTKGDASTFNVTVATGSIPSTGSLLVTASSTNDTITYTKGDGTTFTNVINNVSASISASFANNATSASYALTASYAANVPAPVSTGSLLTTASAAGNVLTFTKGDASTFNVTVATGSSVAPILIASGSQNILFADTASWGGGIESGYSPNQMIILGENAQYSGSGGYAVMFGGINNIARTQGGIMSSGSVMLGGINNTWIGNGESSFLIGGASNTLYRPYGFGQSYGGIIGGSNNSTQYVDGPNAGFVIVTGQANTGNGSYGGIFGGSNNIYSGDYGFIGGGNYNTISNVTYAAILGGQQNQTTYGQENVIAASQYTNARARRLFIGGVYGGSGNNQHCPGQGAIIGGNGIHIPDFAGFNYVVGSFNTLRINYSLGEHYNLTTFGDKNGIYTIGATGTLSGGKESNYGGFFANNVGLKYTGSTWMTSVMNTWATSITGSTVDNNFIANTSGSRFENNKDFVVFGGQGITATSVTGSFVLPNSGSRTIDTNYTLYGENLSFRGSLYDSTNSTGSSGQVLSSNANGKLEWIAAGGGGSINTGSFATTGSNTFIGNEIITGSLTVTGSSNFTGGDFKVIDQARNAEFDVDYFKVKTVNGTQFTGSVSSLNGFTGSLAGTASFANTAITASYVLNAVSSSFASTASFVTTAQTASFYDLSAVTQNAVFSGSVRGEVETLTVSSATASLDCSLGNFFIITLPTSSTTYINPTNIQPGQTINLRVKQQGTTGAGLVSFPSSVKQVSGSAYVPTGTINAEDIVTFISFDSTSLYLSNVKNLI